MSAILCPKGCGRMVGIECSRSTFDDPTNPDRIQLVVGIHKCPRRYRLLAALRRIAALRFEVPMDL